jgi:hypothetical protein
LLPTGINLSRQDVWLSEPGFGFPSLARDSLAADRFCPHAKVVARWYSCMVFPACVRTHDQGQPFAVRVATNPITQFHTGEITTSADLENRKQSFKWKGRRTG